VRILEETQLAAVREGEVPDHVGCIMDGNGRWALMRGMVRIHGHQAAEESVVSTVDAALDLGIGWLSVYAFSTENWSRDRAEVSFLMSFDEWLLRRARRDELNEKGVRIRFVGRLDDPQIPQKSRDWLLETEDLTKGNDRLQLCIAFNYGGRAEIVDAVRALAAAGQNLDDLTEEEFAAHLYVPDMPDIDLVIRTSAEHRLSNFFTWHSTYAEFVFTETLWPDFRGWHLYSAVAEYQTRRRRMGAATVEPG